MVGTAWNFCSAVIGLFMTIYFGWINKHYMWYCQIGFWFAVVGSAVVLFYISESPLWLLKAGRVEEGKLVM